jgi:hypothetical protein
LHIILIVVEGFQIGNDLDLVLGQDGDNLWRFIRIRYKYLEDVEGSVDKPRLVNVSIREIKIEDLLELNVRRFIP